MRQGKGGGEGHGRVARNPAIDRGQPDADADLRPGSRPPPCTSGGYRKRPPFGGVRTAQAVLTQEQLAAFRAELEKRTDAQVVQAQENADWFKESTGSTLSRSDAGTIKAAVNSPFTGKEVVAVTFPIDRFTDRHYLETVAANIQPKVLGAFAEDFLHERLMATLRL